MSMIPIPVDERNASIAQRNKPDEETSKKAPWLSSSNSTVPVQPPMLLLVDDDRIMRMTLREALKNHGYNLKVVQSGEEAVSVLKTHAHEIDAVVLDRELPGISGMDVVAQMKANHGMAGIPIIMLTGSGEQEQVQEGIDAGVYYYLIKPANHVLLCKIIDSALRERRQKQALIAELGRHSTALKTMASCRITVRTLTEAEDAACFLASCFPDPARVIVGLMELLVNAVEHGNLAISYDTKQKLLASDTWHEELNRRATLPENAAKIVDVVYQSKDEGHLVQITDSGNGFEWAQHWHINPARANATHGRGIARARTMAFDRMSYNEKGNSVTVLVAKTKPMSQSYAW